MRYCIWQFLTYSKLSRACYHNTQLRMLNHLLRTEEEKEYTTGYKTPDFLVERTILLSFEERERRGGWMDGWMEEGRKWPLNIFLFIFFLLFDLRFIGNEKLHAFNTVRVFWFMDAALHRVGI